MSGFLDDGLVRGGFTRSKAREKWTVAGMRVPTMSDRFHIQP